MAKLNSYDISSIYADMELDLIASMKRNLSRHEREEQLEGFRWEQWQKAKLKDIRLFQKRNKKIIVEYQKLIDKQLALTLKDSFKTGSRSTNKFIKLMLNRTGNAVKGIFEPKEKNFFKLNNDKVNSLIKSVTRDLHKANYAALRKMDDVYRQTLFKTQMYYSNGAVALEKAVDMAAKDFLNKGIDCITYKNGRQVNIASYAEMCIRTANQRATLMGDGAKRDEFGIHTICSAVHGNTCPLCVEWQGIILIDDVYSNGKASEGDYPLLSTAMKAGFLHVSCRHHPTTFFPGINTEPKPLTKEQQQVAIEKYNAEQKQRGIEKEIRKWKRIEEGSLDADNLAVAHTKVEQLQANMKEHIQANTYLRREPWREKLRESVLNTQNTAIITIKDDIRKQIKSTELPKTLNKGAQEKHIKGASRYKEGRSYLTVCIDDAQNLVDKYHGTGEPVITRKGEWRNQEIVTSDSIIGIDVNNETGIETPTRAFKIHYGKNGTHIVPKKIDNE